MTITSAKRREGDTLEKEEEPPKRLKTAATAKICNDYQGYSFQDNNGSPSIDTVEASSLSAVDFFERFVRQRKPCILDGLPTGVITPINRQLLEELAGNQVIQVEQRFHKGENFGQNRTAKRQVQFTIKDFLRALLDSDNGKSTGDNDKNGSGELLYWSTQEDTDDPFNIPCRQLLDAGKIPASLAVAGNLLLSSCNLWMGASQEGASSGLHHDYHDNFYCLLQGTKRFRLLSPDCAPKLHVYGTIECIHPNGRISYVGNETRADGVPLASLQELKEEDEENEHGDDEEEVVLGKGFDYVSDDDEEGGFDEANQKDDFDEMFAQDDNNSKENNDADDDNDDQQKDNDPNNLQVADDGHPDSFARINPCQADQAALHKDFPSYASCRQCFATVKEGQMLYLPAGWFHEVTSYSSSSNNPKTSDDLGNCHMALNYWYHPPDALDNFDNPYKHDFWKKEERHRIKQQPRSLKK